MLLMQKLIFHGALQLDATDFNKNKNWNIRIRLFATGIHHNLFFLNCADNAFCKESLQNID